MPKLACDVCSDIREYYDTSARIVELNYMIANMAAGHPQGSKIMGVGRIVALRDDVSISKSSNHPSTVCLITSMCTILQHFRNNAAVLLKPGPPMGRMRTYHVLVLSDKETKSATISEI